MVAVLRVPLDEADSDQLAHEVLVTIVDGQRAAEFPVPLGPVGAVEAGSIWALPVILLLALLGGLILNLMPCVLPVLSIKFLGLVSHGGGERGWVVANFLASASGSVVSFLVLAWAVHMHASLWVFDLSNLNAITLLSTFYVSELDSPWSRNSPRFGAHQFQEHMEDTKVFATWFSGGLRAIDVANPELPEEIGYFIPEPGKGQQAPQSNDVEVDGRGLVYLMDRLNGLDILEFSG